MDEQQIGEKLESIRKNMKIFDSIVHVEPNNEDGQMKFYLSKNQKEIVQELLDFFRSLNWQIALNSYKKLELDESKQENREGKLKQKKTLREY